MLLVFIEQIIKYDILICWRVKKNSSRIQI